MKMAIMSYYLKSNRGETVDYEVRKFKFYVSTGYVGSLREEVVEIEIPVGATEREVDDIVAEEYESWLWNTINTGWGEVEGNR
jgi:hypothetical protein